MRAADSLPHYGAGAGPPAAGNFASAPPTPALPAQKEREKIAVLPFKDEQLFRNERRELRVKLAAALGKALQDRELVPLAEVDVELRPIAKSGVRCAFDGVPNHRRVSGKGWLTTELVHVAGFKEKGEEPWVQVNGWQSPQLTLAAPWDPKLPRLERYESAFTSLKALPAGGGLLGGLGGRFMPRGEVKAGTLTLCQRAGFSDCAPETRHERAGRQAQGVRLRRSREVGGRERDSRAVPADPRARSERARWKAASGDPRRGGFDQPARGRRLALVR